MAAQVGQGRVLSLQTVIGTVVVTKVVVVAVVVVLLATIVKEADALCP